MEMPTDLAYQPTEWTEVPVEERHMVGTVVLLQDLLSYLGVDPRLLTFRTLIRKDWEPARVRLDIPDVPAVSFRAVRLESEGHTKDLVIQEVARWGLKLLLTNHRDGLVTSQFRLLPSLAPDSANGVDLRAFTQEMDPCLRTTAIYAGVMDANFSRLWADYGRQQQEYRQLVDYADRMEEQLSTLVRLGEANHRELTALERFADAAVSQEAYQRATAESRLVWVESRNHYLERARAAADATVRQELDRHTELVEENAKLKKRIKYYEKNNRANAANMVDMMKKIVYLQERNSRLLEAWQKSRKRSRDTEPLLPESKLRLGSNFRVSQPLPRYTPELEYAFQSTDLLSADVGTIRRRVVSVPTGATLESCPDSDDDRAEIEEPR